MDTDRTRLFTVANLLAYHVARSDAPLADRLLQAELGSLLAMHRRQESVASLGLDAFLNRIRLAAMSGGAGAAIHAIDCCLERVHQENDRQDSLLYGVPIFAGSDLDRLHELLRIEKILIAWRSGKLSAMDERSARCLVSECSGSWAQLKDEVQFRLRLETTGPSGYSIAPGDTFKRALHRGLVYVDQVDPPAEDLVLKVICDGTRRLEEMSFVCPSTPHLWARTALRWFGSRAAECVPAAEKAVALTEARMRKAIARDLDASVGTPTPTVGIGDASAILKYTDPIIALLERASHYEGWPVADDR